MKNLDKMSRTVGYLEKIYRKLNEHYFESALTMPIITVQSTPLAYGHFTIVKNWKQGSGENYEINIGAGTLDRPIEEICATMCHEMCHQYNLVNGIKDTSRGLSYHNKKFKESAEKRGLIIEHHEKYGWTITKPSDEMLQFCLENDLTEIKICRDEFAGFGLKPKGPSGPNGKRPVSGEPAKTSSTRKYVCPACGCSIRATKDVRIMCLQEDCQKIMMLAK